MRLLALTAAIGALALPATAVAAEGVVLSVSSKRHTIEVVDSHHAVHAFGYAGRLPRLRAGSKIGFAGSRGHIRHVRVISSSSRTVAFLARAISAGSSGVVFGLGDGSKLQFSPKQVAHRRTRRKHLARIASNFGGGLSINIQGLEPGVIVLVTETVAPDRSISTALTVPSRRRPASAAGSRPVA